MLLRLILLAAIINALCCQQYQFAMYAIPLIIFIDRDHKEVKRFVGFYETNVAEYCKVIDKHLY